jgi:hypothetical protein
MLMERGVQRGTPETFRTQTFAWLIAVPGWVSVSSSYDPPQGPTALAPPEREIGYFIPR